MTNIIYSFSESQIKQVHQLYQEAWWAKERSLEDTRLCIQGSQLCIGIIDVDNNLIGFTRVITDFIFKAIVFDVIVSNTKQNKGLGKQLIALVKEHEQLTQVKHIELYCLPEMQSYYASLGFSDEVGGVNLMRCAKP